DVLALGHFQRDTLARRVFGADAIDAAATRVIAPLRQWGYETGSPHLSCLCEALLLNESPLVDDLDAECLERFRRGSASSKRSLYFQLAKALAVDGVLAAPLPVATTVNGTGDSNVAEGVDATWVEWIER